MKPPTDPQLAQAHKLLNDALATANAINNSFEILSSQLAAADHAAKTPALLDLVRAIGEPVHHWINTQAHVVIAIKDAINCTEKPIAEHHAKRLIKRRRADRTPGTSHHAPDSLQND
jgi:3-dehydroquinate dehydratase